MKDILKVKSKSPCVYCTLKGVWDFWMLGNHRIMKVRFSSVPDITMSKAAKVAGLTLWEMEKCMIEQGYRSDYSVEDLEKESILLKDRKA